MALKVGDIVIINDIEQPCARLASVVVAIEGSQVRTQYLCDAKEFDPWRKNGCQNDAAEVTRIEDFGCRLVTLGNRYAIEKVGTSVARYRDGSRREWQDNQPGVCRLLSPVAKAAMKGGE